MYSLKKLSKLPFSKINWSRWLAEQHASPELKKKQLEIFWILQSFIMIKEDYCFIKTTTIGLNNHCYFCILCLGYLLRLQMTTITVYVSYPTFFHQHSSDSSTSFTDRSSTPDSHLRWLNVVYWWTEGTPVLSTLPEKTLGQAKRAYFTSYF